MKLAFLSYARADAEQAKRLYKDLCRLAPIRIWFDRIDLLPGVKWEPAIRKAIRESDYFLAVLSNQSISTRGVRHSELREALEVAKEFPEDWIYLVPIRLDDCSMPISALNELNYADLFPKWKDGIAQLCRTLGSGADGNPITRGKEVRRAQGTGSHRSKATAIKAGEPRQKNRRAQIRKPVRRAFHYKVGLVNLDPNMNNPLVERVARGLNRAQSVFHLVPEPLRAPRQALTTIDGSPQIYIPHLPSSFYKRIGPLDMDCVICLTQRLLTFEENDSVLYNYLAGPSPTDSRVLFVSHSSLDQHAQAAGVTLEIALAYLITAELVNYFLDLGYHPETRNCPMDFTEDHSDLAGGMRAGRFCSHCSKKLKASISQPFAEAFQAMIAWGR